MRMRSVLIMLISVLWMIVFAVPVQAAAITVDNATNIIAVDSVCSLAEAIENANNDAQTHADCVAGAGADTLTITLAATFNATGGAFATSSNLSGSQAYYPDITSDITLIETSANDLDFTSVGNVRVFNVMATGSLTLEGVNILNSTVNPIPNFRAGIPPFPARGGAIYLDDGTLSITDSSLNNNGATGSNYVAGGNQPQPAYGGAIYGTANSTITSLTNGSFLENFVQGGGGTSDRAGGAAYGGAIYTLGSIGVVDNVTLNDNTATGGSTSNEGGEAAGGAIFAAGSIGVINNVTLNGNTATGGFSSAPVPDAQARGGGIYAQTVTSITNSSILNNSVAGGSRRSGGQALGGGIYVPGAIDLIDNVTVSGNSAIGGSGDGVVAFNGQARGGGIYAQTITNLVNSRFTSNTANGGGNSDYDSVSGFAGGGALHVNTASYISNVQFESNTATGGSGRYGGGAQGGAIYAQASVAALRNSTFLANTARGGNGTAGIPDAPWRGGNGDGGAIYANGSAFNNLTFYNNTANGGTAAKNGNGSGGAVSASNTTLTHNTFLSNTANTNGDDLASRGNVTLTASIVTSVGGVADCSGSITDGGNNLRQNGGDTSCPAAGTMIVGTDLASAPADNGCATNAVSACIASIAIIDYIGNPIIDGTGSTCASVDNADGRGLGRTQFCDVGAYESATEIFADIDMTKSVALTVDGADMGLYNPGDTITYTIAVTNNGAVNVTDVIVADTFPSGVTFSDWVATFTGGASGNASGSGDLNETVSIPVNTTVTYTITGVIDTITTGTVSNTASANHLVVTDPDTTNNTSTADFDVTNLTDIGITKAVALTDDGADIGLYNPGDEVTYTIVVTNLGPLDASNVLVTDTFPSSVGITGWIATFTGGASGNASGSGDLNETVSIPVNGTVTYTVTGVITSDAAGLITNTATASITIPADPNVANNTATAGFDAINDGSVFKAQASILGINQIVDENNVTIQATVQLDVPAEFSDTDDVTVTIADAGAGNATSGPDYTAFAPVILTFNGPLTPGTSPQQIVTMDILEDTLVEGAEAFALTITQVTGDAIIGQPDAHTVIINDDDPINLAESSFTSSSAVVDESAGTLTIDVQVLIPSAYAQTGDVVLTISDSGTGTATSGIDYTAFPGTVLTFLEADLQANAGGALTQQVTLAITDDLITEGAETVTLAITGVSGPTDVVAPAVFTAVINDTENDGDPGYASIPGVNSTIDVGQADVGSASTTILTISETGDADLIVSLDSITGTNAGDFAISGLPTTIANGNPPQEITIVCVPLTGGNLTATLNLTTNDPTQPTVSYYLICAGNSYAEVALLGINQIVDEDNITIQATVELYVPDDFGSIDDVEVTIIDAAVGNATSGADYGAFVPVVVTFPGPLTPDTTLQQTVNIQILEDDLVEGAEVFALVIDALSESAVIWKPDSHTVVINDDDTDNFVDVSFVSNSAIIDEAAGTLTIDVQAVVPALFSLAGDVVLNITDAGSGTAMGASDYTSFPPATLTFLNASLVPGTTVTQQITLDILDDSLQEGVETVDLAVTGISGPVQLVSPAVFTAIINDDEIVTNTIILPGGETVVIVGDGTVDFDYITKTVDNPLATVGQIVTYTIQATNPKDIPLTQVVIYDVFDERLVDVTLQSTTHGFGTFAGNTLIVSGFDLQPGEESTIVVSARIAELRVGDVIPNSAILESPDASVHVSNLALVGDSVQVNDGDASTLLIIPNNLPSTGEPPWWRNLAFIVIGITLSSVVGYTLLRSIVSATSLSDAEETAN